MEETEQPLGLEDVLGPDLILLVLAQLSAVDLAKMACVSKLMTLLVAEYQKESPYLASMHDAPGSKGAAALRGVARKLKEAGVLKARPSLGFLFAAGSVKASDVEACARELPRECHLVGAIGQPYLHAGGCGEGAGALLDSISASDDSATCLTLGNFPEAETQVNMLTFDPHMEEEEQIKGVLAEAGLIEGGWGVFVILGNGRSFGVVEEVVAVLQRSHPQAAIIGGATTGSAVVSISDGRVELSRHAMCVMAMRGNVPMFATVSRGCAAISEEFYLASEPSAVAGTDKWRFVDQVKYEPGPVGDAGGIPPLQAVANMNDELRIRSSFGAYLGASIDPEKVGYTLLQLHNRMFDPRSGSMLVPVEFSKPGTTFKFFSLEQEASKADMKQRLKDVEAQAKATQREVLGGFLVTCSGRREQMFGEPAFDASCFRERFPNIPLVGFFAGGEVGPKAVADAPPEVVLQRGDAAVQGFTAVVGLFLQPVNESLPSVLHYTPEAVQEAFAAHVEALRSRPPPPPSQPATAPARPEKKDPQSMSVKELKAELASAGLDCQGAVEKAEIVALVTQLRADGSGALTGSEDGSDDESW
mmetsp:Transcript_24197/g.78862  ORF Transcript_24197/g.78862 Transcript_24197/m.78862 type:complete len:588 (+) Transcript_24197:181-1944(+)